MAQIGIYLPVFFRHARRRGTDLVTVYYCCALIWLIFLVSLIASFTRNLVFRMMGRRNGRIHYFKTYLVFFLTGQPRESASNHHHFELSSLESGTYPAPGLLVCDLKDDVITWFRVQCWNQWARVYFSKTNRIARAWRVQFVVFEAHLVQNCTRNHVLHITEGMHTIISVKLFCFNFRDALITITSLVGDDKLDMISQNCIIMRSQRGQISGSFALFGINWHVAQPNRMQKLLCAYYYLVQRLTGLLWLAESWSLGCLCFR